MNRAERRKSKTYQPPPKMKHLTEDAFNKALHVAYQKGVDAGYEKASNYAVAYMLAVPLLVIHEKFNEVRLKEYQGHTRIEHFFDLCTDTFEEYNDGEDTLERLMRDVLEKTGFDVGSRLYRQKGDDVE